MRVVHIITQLDQRGGAQHFVCDLADAMAAAGLDVEVWHGGGADAVAWTCGPAVRRRHLPVLQRGLGAHDVLALPALAAALRASGCDVVHLHSTKAGLLGCAAATMAGMPAVFTAHGLAAISSAHGGAAGSAGARLAHRLGLAQAAAIIALGERDASALAAIVPSRRSAIVVIPLGLPDLPLPDVPPPQPRTGSGGPPPGRPLRWCTIARHAWPKDAITLIAALSAWDAAERHTRGAGAPASPTWTLDWLGGGPGLEAARASIQAAGLADRVVLHGEVDDTEPHVAAADAILLATRAEGAPRALLQGMRRGLPAIASDVGAIPEMLGDDAGWLVPPADVPAWVLALRHAAFDRSERERRGAAARSRWQRRYRMADVAAAHAQLYGEVVAARRAGGR